MTTFIFSLGTLVETNAQKTIAAFMEIAKKQEKAIELKTVIPTLQSSFADFNLDKIAENDLKIILEKALDITLTTGEFKNAWNAMCTVTNETDAVLEAINNLKITKRVDFYTYSDTNRTHMAHVLTQLQDRPIPDLHTTYVYRSSKADLLKKLVKDIQKDKPDERIIVLVGNAENISEKTVADIIKQRDQEIQAAVEKESNVQFIKLKKPTLTKGELEEIIESHTLLSRVEATLNALTINDAFSGAGIMTSGTPALTGGTIILHSLTDSNTQVGNVQEEEHETKPKLKSTGPVGNNS